MLCSIDSQSVVFRSHGVPKRPFQRVCEVKIVFITVVRHYFLFHCVCIYTSDLKAKVDKSTSTVANIKRVNDIPI